MPTGRPSPWRIRYQTELALAYETATKAAEGAARLAAKLRETEDELAVQRVHNVILQDRIADLERKLAPPVVVDRHGNAGNVWTPQDFPKETK